MKDMLMDMLRKLFHVNSPSKAFMIKTKKNNKYKYDYYKDEEIY